MRICHRLLRWIASAAIFTAIFPALGNPLDTWTSVPSGTTNRLRSIAFGGGWFVATGDFGTALASSNGLVWLPVATGITNSLLGVAYGQDRFVAVGTSGVILTSTNGLIWSMQSSGTPNQLNAVAPTDLGLVAVGQAGTILTSSNGADWVVQNSGTTRPFVGVGGGFGKTFAGPSSSPSTFFWSTNGSVWSYLTNDPIFPVNGGFAFGNGVLLGIGIRGVFNRSIDGVSWAFYPGKITYCFGITWARGVFVSVGGAYSGPGRGIETTADGINWQTRCLQTAEGRLLGAAYGRHRFVAVGDGGSILVSDPMLWLANPTVMPDGLRMTLNGDPGAVYHIQRSKTLPTLSWEEVGVVTNVGDATEFVAPLATDSASAFYRAVSE
jgi:hypothetical protein